MMDIKRDLSESDKTEGERENRIFFNQNIISRNKNCHILEDGG